MTAIPSAQPADTTHSTVRNVLTADTDHETKTTPHNRQCPALADIRQGIARQDTSRTEDPDATGREEATTENRPGTKSAGGGTATMATATDWQGLSLWAGRRRVLFEGAA